MASKRIVVGQDVHYRISEYDIPGIKQNRERLFPSGFFVGNPPSAGEYYPAQIVRYFGMPGSDSTTVNLRVRLDGYDEYWATSRQEGDGEGQWTYPPSDECLPEPSEAPAAPQVDESEV